MRLLRVLPILFCLHLVFFRLSAQKDTMQKDTVQKGLVLLEAAKNGDSTKVRELIGTGVSPEVEYSNGETALILAAKNGYLVIVKDLVEKGANVNVKSYYGYTAPMYMADLGSLKLLKLMVEHGANLNSDAGKLLVIAARKNHLLIMNYLLEEKNFEEFKG